MTRYQIGTASLYTHYIIEKQTVRHSYAVSNTRNTLAKGRICASDGKSGIKFRSNNHQLILHSLQHNQQPNSRCYATQHTMQWMSSNQQTVLYLWQQKSTKKTKEIKRGAYVHFQASVRPAEDHKRRFIVLRPLQHTWARHPQRPTSKKCSGFHPTFQAWTTSANGTTTLIQCSNYLNVARMSISICSKKEIPNAHGR